MEKKYKVLDDGGVQGSGRRRSTRFWMTEEYRVLDDGEDKYRVLDGGGVQGSGWFGWSTGFWMAEEYRVLDGGGVQGSG